MELLVLFCDAIYLPTRPSGGKEGVLVAWGYDETGQRVLLDVVLCQRERFEDSIEEETEFTDNAASCVGL